MFFYQQRYRLARLAWVFGSATANPPLGLSDGIQALVNEEHPIPAFFSPSHFSLSGQLLSIPFSLFFSHSVYYQLFSLALSTFLPQ
jgi:hypothetical protein